MFGILLGERKEIVYAKLYALDRYSRISGYEFLDERLKDTKFKFNDYFAFHNDSLITFELSSEIREFDKDKKFTALKELYVTKYGNPDISEKYSCGWSGKNKNIDLRIFESNINEYECDLIIEYSRPNKYRIEKYKLDDARNSFSKDYWDKNYKHISDSIKQSNINKTNSDIEVILTFWFV